MPELPKAKKVRLVDTYGVSAYQAGVLASEASLANYFEEAAKAKPQNGAAIANFLLNDFLATAVDGAVPHVVPDFFAELVELTGSGQINREAGEGSLRQDDRRDQIARAAGEGTGPPRRSATSARWKRSPTRPSPPTRRASPTTSPASPPRSTRSRAK